jgi:hypothetical protein
VGGLSIQPGILVIFCIYLSIIDSSQLLHRFVRDACQCLKLFIISIWVYGQG